MDCGRHMGRSQQEKLMKMRAWAIVIFAAGFGTILPAAASDLSYNFAELRFVNTDIGNQDGDGLRVAGSFEISQNWLVVGGFTSVDFNNNVDTSTLEIGAGYVHRYNPSLDIIGYAKVVRSEVDFTGGDNSDTGIALAGGVRGRFTPKFEGRATVNYINVIETDTYFELGGDFYITNQFSAGATLEFGGDADTLSLGIRWFFGN